MISQLLSYLAPGEGLLGIIVEICETWRSRNINVAYYIPYTEHILVVIEAILGGACTLALYIYILILGN